MEQVQGIQGYVKKVVLHINKCPVSCVAKKSRFVDFVIELEYNAWCKLKWLKCVHFCPIFSYSPTQIIMKEITHMYNGNAVQNTMGDIIGLSMFPPEALYNCIIQALHAIVILQECSITHYDLHCDNIMIGNTPYDIHVYDNYGHYETVETFGIVPVIIDFGMSYVEGSEFNATIASNSNGFTTYMFDHLIDARLLLMTARKDVKNAQDVPDAIFTQFINQVEFLFKTNSGLKNNGWFRQNTFFDLNKYLLKLYPDVLNKKTRGVLTVKNYIWFIELFKHCIVLPLNHQDNNCLKTKHEDSADHVDIYFMLAVLDFSQEWDRVENILKNTRKEQEFLKTCIASAAKIFRASNQSQLFLNTVLKLRRKWPTIKNFLRLFRCIHNITKNYFDIINRVMIKTSNKKRVIYHDLKMKDIVNSFSRQNTSFKQGMTLYFVKENVSKTLTKTDASILVEAGILRHEILVNILNRN